MAALSPRPNYETTLKISLGLVYVGRALQAGRVRPRPDVERGRGLHARTDRCANKVRHDCARSRFMGLLTERVITDTATAKLRYRACAVVLAGRRRQALTPSLSPLPPPRVPDHHGEVDVAVGGAVLVGAVRRRGVT